ncbi:MAG: hypothetical protein ACI8UP_005498 [Porticoccaceae bacterium]|jgi:hypothetical protein
MNATARVDLVVDSTKTNPQLQKSPPLPSPSLMTITLSTAEKQ